MFLAMIASASELCYKFFALCSLVILPLLNLHSDDAEGDTFHLPPFLRTNSLSISLSLLTFAKEEDNELQNI
jgi:hypothetical protein